MLHLGVHERLKRRFYDTEQLIAVNGESVVVHHGADEVDKFMFRFPRRMGLETFRSNVAHEVGAVTHHLSRVALLTDVSIKPARIFKNPNTQVDGVAQTQRRLDLVVNPELTPQLLPPQKSPVREQTARNLEKLVIGSERLLSDYGFYPDVANSGGNLRLNPKNGTVTLIDVMPFYEDGSRLVGSAPPNVIPHIQQNLAAYAEFVGQYGA